MLLNVNPQKQSPPPQKKNLNAGLTCCSVHYIFKTTQTQNTHIFVRSAAVLQMSVSNFVTTSVWQVRTELIIFIHPHFTQ